MSGHMQLANGGRKHAYFARNRAALLASTQRVLAERGGEATIDEFASAADMAVSTIYKHFENRDALIQAAVLAAMETWEGWMSETLSSLSDPLEQLVLPLVLFIRMPETHPVFAQVALNSPRAVSAVLPLLAARFRTNLADLIESGQLTVHNVEARFSALSAIIRSAFEISTAGWPESEPLAREMLSVGLELIGLIPDQSAQLLAIDLPATANI